MPFDGDYEPSTEDELFETNVSALASLDDTAGTGQGTMNRALLRTMARLLADNQEQTLDELYDATYIETASGRELELRCKDIGIRRNEAVPATGVVEFSRDSEPVGDFVIPSGTLVQPVGSDVPTYETTETTSVGILEDFESGSLAAGWTHDTGSFSVVDGSAGGDPTPDSGTYEMKIDAVTDALVYHNGITVAEGDTIRFSVYCKSNTIVSTLFFVTDQNNHFRVTVDASAGSVTLEKVDGGTGTDLDSQSVTVPTGEWLTVDIDTGVNTDTTARVLDSSDSEVASVSSSDSTFTSGFIGLRSGDNNATKYADDIVTTATAANVEGTAGGTQTNVGGQAITEMVSSVSGIDSVINPVAVGDPSFVDTNGNGLVIGVDRETDDELRERAFNSTSIGGSTTVPAVYTAIASLDGVVNVKIFENDTLNDNTGSGGLPPVSIEVVIYGGSTETIANTLFDVTAPTERLYSGAHGTTVTYTVESSVLGSNEVIEWSDPPITDVDLTLDVVHDETYVGDEEIRRILVEYIGGTLPDGSTATGTGIGEDVRFDAIRDRLVGNDTGVLGLASISSTPSSSTDSNGLNIVDIANDAVAETDATDGSISITTTQV